MAVAIVKGRKSLGVRANGALGRRLVILARGLPDVYLTDSKDAALVAVIELIYVLTKGHESQLQEQQHIQE